MKRTLTAVGLVVTTGLVAAGWILTGAADRAPTRPPATASPPTAGPLPDAALVAGSEVQTPAASAVPVNQVPPLPMRTPLVAVPLPAGGSADGALVDGFPAVVAGPLAGDDVISSSVAVEGTVMQATLMARTGATAAEVRDDYASRWSGLGLAASVAGADAYADPFSSVMLAFAEGSVTGTVYTVYAVLRTE